MAGWTEDDSRTYLAIADIAVPWRVDLLATMISLVPFSPAEAPRIIELGAGDGRFASALLDGLPHATLVALDGSAAMRAAANARLARFGDRARVASFDAAALDWWEQLFGADVVVSVLALHHLNDAKKQYVYKAIADRLSDRGALLMADLVAPAHPAARWLAADVWDTAAKAQAAAVGDDARFEQFAAARWNHFRFPDAADQPAALFHHLVWLKHAGFAAVDAPWIVGGHAVMAGYKQREWTGSGLAYAAACRAAQRALEP